MSHEDSDSDDSTVHNHQELGITESKEHNTGEWYAEVVQKAKLADYAPIGGFIVTRPRGYALWEQVQNHLDAWFKSTGAQNAYFPMMIPESYLEQEAEIVEGFDPEVAWVTHGGYNELEERLAVRPTSESIIAPFMAQWTRSHRDLPLRLNQWCSVVRWEATDTKPFFRTKEFLWQEGHTAHATEQSAWDETMTRLDQYERLYEEIFAIPVLKGRKPEHDKFPGADTTTTIEVLMPDGKSVQGATSHYLGQSFGEAFDITFTDQDEDDRTAHTTSWGLSWRALGALIMTHSDDQGLVLPPAMAPEQVVVVPIWDSDSEVGVRSYAQEVANRLSNSGLRVEYDDRETYSPGFKFNEHELQGVPLRVEIGPNELADRSLTIVQRPDGAAESIAATEAVAGVNAALESVHATLYERAGATLESNIREATEFTEILGTIGEHGGYVRTPWCGDEACETAVKDEVHAEVVMVPFEDGATPEPGAACTVCGGTAEQLAYFARSH